MKRYQQPTLAIVFNSLAVLIVVVGIISAIVSYDSIGPLVAIAAILLAIIHAGVAQMFNLVARIEYGIRQLNETISGAEIRD